MNQEKYLAALDSNNYVIDYFCSAYICYHHRIDCLADLTVDIHDM